MDFPEEEYNRKGCAIHFYTASLNKSLLFPNKKRYQIQ